MTFEPTPAPDRSPFRPGGRIIVLAVYLLLAVGFAVLTDPGRAPLF